MDSDRAYSEELAKIEEEGIKLQEEAQKEFDAEMRAEAEKLAKEMEQVKAEKE